ncbi:hypothetical protein BC567DRAFT_231450 [Phyllosticta citribraziliensis]
MQRASEQQDAAAEETNGGLGLERWIVEGVDEASAESREEPTGCLPAMPACLPKAQSSVCPQPPTLAATLIFGIFLIRWRIREQRVVRTHVHDGR